MSDMLESVRLRLAQRRLRRGFDHRQWKRLAAEFPRVLGSMDGLDLEPWVTPLWEGFNAKMSSALTPTPPKAFLRESVIRQSMFVDVRGEWLRAQLGVLRAELGEQWMRTLVREIAVGDPPLCDASLMTSHNTVHHLTHLTRYSQATGWAVSDSKSVLEWGGGYGNLCRLVRRMHPNLQRYLIVDTPLFCALQWLYLSMALGAPNVHLWLGQGRPPESGVVIVPVSLARELEVEVDLCISTWAISECSSFAQDYVSGKRNWYGAERLLLAFQASNEQLPNAGRLDAISRDAGCAVMPVEVIDDNFYAFR